MMNNLRFWTMMILLGLLIGACKKVEELTTDQNPLLPMAVGNRWVYVDTFITTTSLPSVDTLVSAISYRVENEIAVDRYLESGSNKGKIVRTMGWELLNSSSNNGRETIFAIGDTLYSSAYYWYFRGSRYTDCNGMHGSTHEEVPTVFAFNEAFKPVIWSGGKEDQSMSCYPGFMDLDRCTIGLGPLSQDGIFYKALFPSLNPRDSLETITTPAGTFTCINFGYQYWSEGVGMIQSNAAGGGSFYDENAMFQTCSVKWKRSLASYHLE